MLILFELAKVHKLGASLSPHEAMRLKSAIQVFPEMPKIKPEDQWS